MGDTVYIPHPEYCDLCKSQGLQVEAVYDGKTVHGPWAYMCENHFGAMGVGLGTGRGQRLIVGEKPDPKASSERGITEVDDEDDTDETIASNVSSKSEPRPAQTDEETEEVEPFEDESGHGSTEETVTEIPVAEKEVETPAKKRKRLRAARRKQSIEELMAVADNKRADEAKNTEAIPVPVVIVEEEPEVPYIMKMDWGDLSR